MRCSVLVIGLTSIAIAIFGILVYEYNILSIGDPIRDNGWPNTARNLCYGVLSGWMIYIITVGIPYFFDWQNNQESIKEILVELNLELSYFINSENIDESKIQYISLGCLSKEKIVSSQSYAYIVNEIHWDSTFQNTKNRYVEQAFYIIMNICKTISEISMQYRGFLTVNQQKCFDAINYFVFCNNFYLNYDKDDSKREETIKEVMYQIAYPLQKSLGIPLYGGNIEDKEI